MAVEHQNSHKVAQAWFAFLFLGLVALIVLMAWDYLTPIIFGLIISGAFYPVHNWLCDRWQLSRRLAASLTSLLILLVVMLPVIYIVARLAQEASKASQLIMAWLTKDNIEEIFFGKNYLSELGRQAFVLLNMEYSLDSFTNLALQATSTLSSILIDSVRGLLSNTLYFLLQFFIMMLVIYSVLKEGPRLKEYLFRLSPMPEADERLIVERFNQMNFVTLVCNGLGGLIQGSLAGLAFFLAGVPSSLLWTVLMVILAFIPLVGISLVYVPVTIYLMIAGKYWTAAIIFVYCTLVSLVTENWFKPIFMGNRVQINSMLVFLSILGGMSVFGMAGIFYGPLIVIIFLTFVELYLERYAPKET